MLRLALVPIALALLAACNPDFKSGMTACAAVEPRCPEGFVCINDLHCYKAGEAVPPPIGSGGSPGRGGAPGQGGAPGLGGSPGQGGSPGLGGSPGGTCSAGQTSCPARDGDPALCISAPGTCKSAVDCAGRTVACPGATDVVDCSMNGTCQALGTTCNADSVEADPDIQPMTKPCVRCLFRKCCSRLVACDSACIQAKTSPEYMAFLNCGTTYCRAACQ